MSWRRLSEVFARCLEDVFKASWRQDVLKVYDQDEYIGLDQDVFWRRRRKTYSSRRMFAGYNLRKPKFYLRYVDNILTAFDNEQYSLNF